MNLQPTPPEDPVEARARGRLGNVLQDKWTLDTLLGVGGMAAVYAATHRNGKRVAVKMLHPDLSHDEEVRRRFLQEGYAANTIQHEGAVSVLDDDVAVDGSAFIVMELLEGETVERRWDRHGRRLPEREVLAITEQVLDVLAAAHAKNVVHRDIKPENLFVTKSGLVKVLDFGIARVLEGRSAGSTSTRVGMVMGTPAFMAPEQALGHWDKVDGRTDLWAVGATMFTLLLGRHVHDTDVGNEQLVLAATQAPPSMATLTSELSAMTVQIVDRALAFQQGERYPDAASMQQAVRNALDALGGPDTFIESGRRTSATVARSSIGSQSATVVDPSRTMSASAWAKEIQMRTAEAARLRSSITELTQRFAAAKKATSERQSSLDAVRAERASLEEQFKRQTGTRAAAVEDARKQVRAKKVALARQALADSEPLGFDAHATRARIAKLDRAAEAARRDVDVHSEALRAYDPRAFRTGLVMIVAAMVLLLASAVGLIAWRATRVVLPPIPTAAPAGAPRGAR